MWNAIRRWSIARSSARLAALGALFVFSLGRAAVPVDQSPLTIRSVLAPNIVMMLDDSGSMAWSVMPDNPPGSDGADSELINPFVNGVYYNPAIVYLPPYTETAQPEAVTPTTTRYADATFESAWLDGFDGGTTVNIATYKGASDSTTNSISTKPRFSHTFRLDISPQYEYAESSGCPAGFVGPDASGQCSVQPVVIEPPRCQGHGNGDYNDSSNNCDSVSFRPDPCGSTLAPGASGTPNSPGLSLNNDQCKASGRPSEAPRCQGYGNNSYSDNRNRCDQESFRPAPCGSEIAPGASGSANSPGLTLADISGPDQCRSATTTATCPTGYEFSLDAGPAGEDCQRQTTAASTKYRSLFVYMVRTGAGTADDPYVDTRHYVGVATAGATDGSQSSPLPGTCAEIAGTSVTNIQTGEVFSSGFPGARCHNMGDDSGLRDPSNNVITIGQNVANWFSYYRKRIMMAKSGLMNAFATLDPAIRLGFGSINGDSDGDNASRLPNDKTTGTPRIALVKPFGNGGAGTQRSAFWNWLDQANASGSTPLRRALKATGEYYTTDQPWQSGIPENADDPTQELSCRQSYAILMTDGFWNGPSPSVGDVDDPDDIVRRDGPNAQCFEYPQASAGSACESPIAVKPFADSDSDTLADVAMKFWLDDLRTAANEVPSTPDDPAFWQHMSTFTVGLFGQDASLPGLGTIAAEDIALWARNGGAPNNFNWPTPSSDSANNISDLVHAGINGRGGFFSAGDPVDFEQGVRDALRRVQDRVGTGASLAANSTRLDTGTTTYQSLYFSGKWKGEVNAYAVDGNSGVIAATPSWTASGQMPTWDSRSIKTYNPTGADAAAKFPAFSTPATLSSAQQTELGGDATERQNLINYLRGSPALERRNGGTFRNRDTPLGDIVSSQPVFVGAPNSNLYINRSFTGSSAYAAFAGAQAARSPRLWLAANDGMLHSFNTVSGAEVFAFLPNAVILSGVKSLANPSYGSAAVPHQYYNDGELTVADAYIGGAWKTVLVGTTGRGPAKAVYALDITDPAAPAFLWERSAGDGLAGSDFIGQIVGKPVIAQTANGTWSALMGNGYNSAQDKAALLQFNLADGSLNVHPISDNTDANNGLSQPAVWIADATNAVSTQAYAGDLKGRVWAFDLSSATSTGSLLFTAAISGTAQPITGGLLAGKDPDTGNVWVFFGTGRYLAAGTDLQDTSLQSWYGLIVQAGSGQPASLVTNLASSGRGALIERTILSETAPTTSPPTLGKRRLEEAADGDMAGKSGWFLDLMVSGGTQRGERMVTPNQFQGTLLLGTTRIPGSGSNPCNPSGDGWIMAINPFTGGAPTDVFFDVNGDGQFDDDDKIGSVPAGGIGFTSIPNNPIFVGNVMLTSFDDATTSSIRTAGSGGVPRRQSWRELIGQ